MIKALLNSIARLLALYVLGTSLVFADYQQGLDAYIQGDFAGAQAFWLAGSKQKDARSMFNLGLLHQQRKVTNASQEQAHKWLRLASEHGYVPAAYHLGLLILDDQRAEGIRWIKIASEQGYYPANKYLANLDGLDVTEFESSKTSLRSEKWITELANDRWTIQLLAFNEFAKVQAFVNEHDIQEKVAFFREPSGGVMLFKLMYGDYSSKDDAQQARDALPASLTRHGPWLRRIDDVKAAIAALEK